MPFLCVNPTVLADLPRVMIAISESVICDPQAQDWFYRAPIWLAFGKRSFSASLHEPGDHL